MTGFVVVHQKTVVACLRIVKQGKVSEVVRTFETTTKGLLELNLLGHAARKIVQLAAKVTELPVETIAQQARIPLAVSSSTKTALDCDWSDPEQRSDALVALVAQLGSLDQKTRQAGWTMTIVSSHG